MRWAYQRWRLRARWPHHKAFRGEKLSLGVSAHVYRHREGEAYGKICPSRSKQRKLRTKASSVRLLSMLR